MIETVLSVLVLGACAVALNGAVLVALFKWGSK